VEVGTVGTPPLVVAVANEKGGAGKTSTCINLGYALAQRGLRVGLVDTDVQCNLTTAQGDHLLPAPGEDLGAALRPGGVDLSDRAWLERITITGVAPGMDLVPGTKAGLMEAAIALQARPAEGIFRLQELLAAAPFAWDVVLVDTPGELGAMFTNALVASRWLLVPLKPDKDDLRGARTVLDALRAAQRLRPELAALGLVLQQYELTTNATRLLTDLCAELAGAFGVRLLRTRIPKDVKVRDAANRDAPVGQAYPVSRAAIMYRALADEVLSIIRPHRDGEGAVLAEAAV
jgi:chromosome partitioning protein